VLRSYSNGFIMEGGFAGMGGGIFEVSENGEEIKFEDV
jgi:hypothetical protein